MKQVKLRRINRIKYCLCCEQEVEIIMVGLDGYCPNEFSLNSGRYYNKLYTIDTRGPESAKK